ncbi:MAG: hypothetical protein PHV74_05380 [Dehalococcoidia bacterium]|nr:hypothetical protein [Dehalococcoidia bacterium]
MIKTARITHIACVLAMTILLAIVVCIVSGWVILIGVSVALKILGFSLPALVIFGFLLLISIMIIYGIVTPILNIASNPAPCISCHQSWQKEKSAAAIIKNEKGGLTNTQLAVSKNRKRLSR